MRTVDTTLVTHLAAAHAEQADRDGRLDAKVIAALVDSGIPQHFVPHGHGGSQGTFTDVLPALVDLAQADPSAGWCAAVMTSMSRAAARLPGQGQEALWSTGPDSLVAGTLQPSGTVETSTPGGWTISGTWPFVSGAEHAQWALLSTTVPNAHGADELRFLLVPRSAWTVQPSWEAIGLRATGSHTLKVAPVFVPAAHSFTRVDLFTARRSGPVCHQIPHEAVSGLFFAAPMLGAAKALLTACTHAARNRPASPSGSAPDTDLALAVSAGQLEAAELLLQRSAATADGSARPSPAVIIRCRLDYATAASLVTDAANRLFREAGARATSSGGPIARLWRDVSTASVHPALHLNEPARAYAQHVLVP